MREDELLAEAADRHVRPAAPGFFDAFWREAEQRQRRAARRWRAATLALAAVALAATSAAGVLASSRAEAAPVVDRTLECTPLRDAGSGAVFSLHTSVTTPRTEGYFHLSVLPPLEPAALGPPGVHFDVSSGSVTFETHLCRSARNQPVFSSRGLVADNVYTPTFVGGFLARCRTAGRIRVRTHVVFSHGKPVSAKVVVVDATTGKPRAYIEWSPRRIADWLGRSCDKLGY